MYIGISSSLTEYWSIREKFVGLLFHEDNLIESHYNQQHQQMGTQCDEVDHEWPILGKIEQ